ncbi:MAG: phosphoglycerate mutase family protein [Planctomycetota bacterium]|nr:phosphoglycerate mutase family protein [Planctomycetota bacterium]MDA1213080.1 phosphoglycerate mutase family protein [Planctomycetota bacterium]
MSRVILISPGSTDFDEQARIQGTLELPLNQNGIRQVQEMVSDLGPLSLEAIYSAPEGAARETADLVGTSLGIRVTPSDDLRNLNQGLWQGLQIDEIRRKFPRVFKQWEESPETIRPPDGETISEAKSRIKKGLQKPLLKYKSIAIVAPEPAASLIRQIISNDDEAEICPICNGPRGAGWEDLLPIDVVSPAPSDENTLSDHTLQPPPLTFTALPGASHS